MTARKLRADEAHPYATQSHPAADCSSLVSCGSSLFLRAFFKCLCIIARPAVRWLPAECVSARLAT